LKKQTNQTFTQEKPIAKLAEDRLQIYKLLGLKIAFYRKQKGMTQLDLAEKVHISRTYISNIEAPRCLVNPTLEILLDIANELDVPISKLFDDSAI